MTARFQAEAAIAHAYYAADNDRLETSSTPRVASAAERQKATEALLRLSLSDGVWAHPEGVTMWGQPWRPMFCDWAGDPAARAARRLEPHGHRPRPVGCSRCPGHRHRLPAAARWSPGSPTTVAAGHRPVAHRGTPARPRRARPGRPADRGGAGRAAGHACRHRPDVGRARRHPRDSCSGWHTTAACCTATATPPTTAPGSRSSTPCRGCSRPGGSR